MTTKPKIDVPVSTLERMLDAAALLFSGGALLFAIYHFAGLPEQIPTHFNVSGEVDGHGAKIFVFVLPVIALLTALGIIYLSRFPDKFNHIRKITPENAAYEYERARFILRVVNVLVSLLLFLLTAEIVQVARGLAFPLGSLIWVILVAVLVVPLLLFGRWPKKQA